VVQVVEEEEVMVVAVAVAGVVVHMTDQVFVAIVAINQVILLVIVHRIVIKLFATTAIRQVI
jgi:hypothetical protein